MRKRDRGVQRRSRRIYFETALSLKAPGKNNCKRVIVVGEESEPVRVPNSLIETADKIAEKKDIPRTKAFNIMFNLSYSNLFSKAVRQAEEELEQNLSVEYKKEEVEKAISSLKLAMVLRKIFKEKPEGERDERIDYLNNKINEFIQEYKEVE